jgi:hypothetical protein
MTVMASALDAVKQGQHAKALRLLLNAWQRDKSPALREAVLALDTSLQRAPFDGTTEAWAKLAANADEVERGTLIKALKGPRVADTRDRLQFAASFVQDPRVTVAVEALLAEVPYSADSSKPAWTAAFALVTASQDPHFSTLAATLPAKWKVRDSMKNWLAAAFARAIEPLPRDSPSPSAAVEIELEALKAALAPAPPKTGAHKSEAALLEAIYAAYSGSAAAG